MTQTTENQTRSNRQLPRPAREGAKPFRASEVHYSGSVIRIVENNGTMLLKLANRVTVQSSTGEDKEVPTYVNAVAVGEAAVALRELKVKKGDVIEVNGGLESSQSDGASIRIATAKKLEKKGLKFFTDKKKNKVLLDGINEVKIMGNLTRDPVNNETRTAKEPVSHFTVAVNERYYGKDSQLKERAAFISVTAFRAPAEVAGGLKKGNGLTVTGMLQNNSFEDRSGKMVYQTILEASAVKPQVKAAQN